MAPWPSFHSAPVASGRGPVPSRVRSLHALQAEPTALVLRAQGHCRRPPSREGPVMPRSAGWSGPAAVSMVTARIRWLLSRGRDTARPAAVERSLVQRSGALPRAGRAQPSHAARAPGTPCPQPPLLLPPWEPPASSSSLLSPASGVDAGRHGDPHWAASSVSSQTVCVHTDSHLPVSVTCTPDDEH